MSQMTDSELKSILAAEIADSLAHLGGELSEQRRKALRYYLGEPFGNEQEGRSKVVSTDVSDTIEWILPSLLKIFTAGDEVVRFEPAGPEDEDVAKQATEYVNWIFTRDNPGFVILYTLFKDSLLQKNGIAKLWWEEGETAARESYSRKTFEEIQLILADPDVEPIAHSEYQDVGVTIGPNGLPMGDLRRRGWCLYGDLWIADDLQREWRRRNRDLSRGPKGESHRHPDRNDPWHDRIFGFCR